MNAADALNAAIFALKRIEKLADDTDVEPEQACEEIANISVNVLAELNEAGYSGQMTG